jgi:HSP20 family protein
MTNLILRPNRMSRAVDTWFNDFLHGMPLSVENDGAFMPRVDIREDKDNVAILFELPGMEKKDIKVAVKDHTLTVSGERRFEHEDKDAACVRTEIRTGSFARSFTLPEYVEEDKIAADYKAGMLEIKLPKVEEVKAKEIDVQVR